MPALPREAAYERLFLFLAGSAMAASPFRLPMPAKKVPAPALQVRVSAVKVPALPQKGAVPALFAATLAEKVLRAALFSHAPCEKSGGVVASSAGAGTFSVGVGEKSATRGAFFGSGQCEKCRHWHFKCRCRPFLGRRCRTKCRWKRLECRGMRLKCRRWRYGGQGRAGLDFAMLGWWDQPSLRGITG